MNENDWPWYWPVTKRARRRERLIAAAYFLLLVGGMLALGIGAWWIDGGP